MSEFKHTVGSFLFDYLHQQGLTHIFGIPGDFALPTFRWIERSELELITMTHEPSVGFAADAYARIHGLSACAVTYCVGGLNMLNSIACAYAEKSPVLVISGGPSPADRQNADQLIHHKVRTFDSQRRIYEEVTCATTVLLDPDTAADEIIRVVNEVRTQMRPGYIEIPYDVVDLPCKAPTLRNAPPAPQSDGELLHACVEDAAEMIAGAKQPVIIADIELHRYGLMDEALEIAKKFNIPVATTLLSKSAVSDQNPLYIGVYCGRMSEEDTQAYVEESDCVIMLGAFISDVLFGFSAARLDRKKMIVVTTEKTRVGLRRYDGVLFKDFLDTLAAQKIAPFKIAKMPQLPAAPAPLTSSESADAITVESFFRILGLHLKPNDTIVCDTGDAVVGAINLRTSSSNNFLSDAYYLSMGFAVPAALGAIAAVPGSRVIAIVGDGAFQMTGIELSTAAKFGMKPIVIIMNNDGYGTQRKILDGPFNEIHRWEYTKICELLNYGKAIRVTTKGECDAALKEAAKGETMVVIEVMIERGDYSRPLLRLGEELGKRRDKDKAAA